MRPILVLLILVMIGLNGKGQSVTALPDSVLSQCCLEVTLLNGNVTTVDWVFIQYITRDGSGTKLFVEYAPNFGGIQWETQIRIQDDFDDVIERSKFIILPFTVGSTDYGIHRNWIANIEENTTTGGTWIYGRFGTPTKRKFSAVEDYETLKNLLLACRPRAIIVAENGLYTEGDTVRMGGFLIEPTTITTEGYNWQMKDNASTVEFGIDYNTPDSGDTTAYFARRFGVYRQLMVMGRTYWDHTIEDTTGITDKRGRVTNGLDAEGNPYIYLFSRADNYLGWFSQTSSGGSWTFKDYALNQYYTHSVSINPYGATIGSSESGTGDPGNGVLIGTYGYGIGADEFVVIKTKNVDNQLAHPGQFLQLIDSLSGKVEFATIDFSPYVMYSDTAFMLRRYFREVGFGILATGSHTIRVDTSSGKISTWYHVATNPTTIANTRVAVSNGTNLVGYAGFSFNGNSTFVMGTAGNSLSLSFPSTVSGFTNAITTTYGSNQGDLYLGGNNIRMTQNSIRLNTTGGASVSLEVNSGSHYVVMPGVQIWGGGSPTGSNMAVGATTAGNATSYFTVRGTTRASSPFPIWTTTEANAITGVANNWGWESGTVVGLRGYNGTRKFYLPESTFAVGTNTYVPYFDVNGQITQNANFLFNTAGNFLVVTGSIGFGQSSGDFRIKSNENRDGFTSIGRSPGSAGSTVFLEGNQGSPVSKWTFASQFSVGGTRDFFSTESNIIGVEMGFGNPNTNNNGNILHLYPTINKTNANTTIFRGLYFNPTITSLGTNTTLRSIETTMGDVLLKDAAGVKLQLYSNVNNSGSPEIQLGNGIDATKAGIIRGTAAGASSWVHLDIINNSNTYMRFLMGSTIPERYIRATKPFVVNDTMTITGVSLNSGNKFLYFNGNSSGYTGNAAIIAVPQGVSSRIGGLGFAINNTGGGAWGNATTSDFALYVNNDRTVGIGTTTPARKLHVAGEVRITDLITDAPTQIVGADADGDLGAITVGTGLSLIAGVLTATGGSADGNGIYSGSATLSQHTTRALIPSTGNLLFSQRYNSNADSAYFHFVNYGDGERALNFGLTDTASTGYARASFYSDGTGVMNWGFETSDAVFGNTLVRAFEGDLLFSVNTGNISITAPVDSEVRTVGLVRAKQEAYFEINSMADTIDLSNVYSDNFINAGMTVTTQVHRFPASPEDGQILKITFKNAISSLTLMPGAGHTIVGSTVTTAVVGSQRVYKFYAGEATWVRQN